MLRSAYLTGTAWIVFIKECVKECKCIPPLAVFSLKPPAQTAFNPDTQDSHNHAGWVNEVFELMVLLAMGWSEDLRGCELYDDKSLSPFAPDFVLLYLAGALPLA